MINIVRFITLFSTETCKKILLQRNFLSIKMKEKNKSKYLECCENLAKDSKALYMLNDCQCKKNRVLFLSAKLIHVLSSLGVGGSSNFFLLRFEIRPHCTVTFERVWKNEVSITDKSNYGSRQVTLINVHGIIWIASLCARSIFSQWWIDQQTAFTALQFRYLARFSVLLSLARQDGIAFVTKTSNIFLVFLEFVSYYFCKNCCFSGHPLFLRFEIPYIGTMCTADLIENNQMLVQW